MGTQKLHPVLSLVARWMVLRVGQLQLDIATLMIDVILMELQQNFLAVRVLFVIQLRASPNGHMGQLLEFKNASLIIFAGTKDNSSHSENLVQLLIRQNANYV